MNQARRATKIDARVGAVETIRAVIAGRSLNAALTETLARIPAAPTRALVQELSYGGIRYWWELNAQVRACLRKPLKRQDEDVAILLALGVYQLRHMRIAPHAAVNETVKAVAALGKDWARPLVNAVLRTLLRGDDTAALSPEARFNHPTWLLAQLQADWPAQWQEVCGENNTHAPMVLRVNLKQSSRAAYLARLTAAGIDASLHPACASAIVLTRPCAVEALPGFATGAVSVQDAAAQQAAWLLEVPAQARVLDACAAPGGKTGHLLEQGDDARVLALDCDEARLQRLQENLTRLQLNAQVAVGDARIPAQWWDGALFDAILLDAPCSGTGVIRRHPDIKIHRQAADISALVQTQAQLLQALWPLLRVGGKLLYATCSILKAENEQQVEQFLLQTPDAHALALTLPFALARGPGYQLLPGAGGMDGFFYACLHKQ